MKYLQNFCYLILGLLFLIPGFSFAESSNGKIDANISSPSVGTYYNGQILEFNTMYLGKYPYYNFNWKSNLSGDFGNSASFSKALPVGKYTITLTVTDTRDNSKSQASVEINIVDANVKIMALAMGLSTKNGETPSRVKQDLVSGQTVIVGKIIEFSAVWDKQIAMNSNSPLRYAWTSSISGNLGNYSTFNTNNLPVGKHKITLTVTLPDGKTNQDSMNIEVVPGDFMVNLDLPKSGSKLGMSRFILFNADVFGGKPPYVVEWSSDLQGPLTKSRSVSYSDNSLKVGKHNITLTVTDANGAKKTLHTDVEVIKKSPQSAKPYPCEALKVSGDPNKKIDFVVAADKTSNLTSAELAQSGKEIMDNILSKEPFKSNANKFNFYYIDKLIGFSDNNTDVRNVDINGIIDAYCPSDFNAVIVADGSAALPRSTSTANATGNMFLLKSQIDTALHEFGHSFGDLGDQYNGVSMSMGGSSNQANVNCDIEPTCMKWKDIPGTGCYQGCGVAGDYRPAEKSIMQGGETAMNEAAGFVSFDPVSEKRLRAVLALWDENPGNNAVAPGAATTTAATCQMPGNNPPCGTVTFAETKNAIAQLVAGKISIGDVIKLINSWFQLAKYPAN